MRTKQKRHWDVQRSRPAGECGLCGGEVYHGERYWRIWGWTLCRDCIGPWLAEHTAYIGEVRP